MAVRAIRGATRLSADDPVEMSEAVVELVTAMLERNDVDRADLISALFTATPDLVSMFPAAAARGLGLGDVPLICAQEIDVAGVAPGRRPRGRGGRSKQGSGGTGASAGRSGRRDRGRSAGCSSIGRQLGT